MHIAHHADRRVELEHHRLRQEDRLALLTEAAQLALGQAGRARVGLESQQTFDPRARVERRHGVALCCCQGYGIGNGSADP